jgi:hypothetical protein
MTGTTWNVPSSLQIISGQGTNCLIVTPANGIADGTTGTITAQAIMVGGCAAVNAPQKNFTIYTSENPPVPQGYITLELDGGGPCDNPVYIVVWHPTQLYLNGYTSVSPGIVLGGTHPHGGGGADRIKITVCNVNLCSGRKSCIEFWVDRPYPCGDMGLTTPTLVYTDAFPSDTNDRSEAGPVGEAEEITIYPNPSTGHFYLTNPADFPGHLTLLDYTGRIITNKILPTAGHTSPLTDLPLPKGIYLVQINMENKSITKKIIVQ